MLKNNSKVDVPTSQERILPLCVDLDGTIVKTDLFLESTTNAIVINIFNLFKLPCWLFRGRAVAKEKAAAISSIDPLLIPYNEELLKYLKKERLDGRKIVLATASDRKIARRIADHLGIFDEVIASDGMTNMKGEAKADALVERYGERGFIYAGDSRSDLKVWRRADSAILINTGRSVSKSVASLCPVVLQLQDTKSTLTAFLKEIRPHQWLKNLLVFIPPMAGHILFVPTVLYSVTICFLAFCFAASGTYIINDLFDLEADRNHLRKRSRPFASGDLPLHYGLLGPVFWVIAITIGSFVTVEIVSMVLIYITISMVYSHYLKTKPLIDIFCLAFLYTIRVYAGGSASMGGVSIWLLNFSGFLFLSLGFVKRYSEFINSDDKSKDKVFNRRGYNEKDLSLIIIMGVCSSFIATTVFAFYVDSMESHIAYKFPFLLWGIIPLVLFWQLRLWLAVVRGEMNDEPIIYAATDKISLLLMLLVFVVYLLASVGLPL